MLSLTLQRRELSQRQGKSLSPKVRWPGSARGRVLSPIPRRDEVPRPQCLRLSEGTGKVAYDDSWSSLGDENRCFDVPTAGRLIFFPYSWFSREFSSSPACIPVLAQWFPAPPSRPGAVPGAEGGNEHKTAFLWSGVCVSVGGQGSRERPAWRATLRARAHGALKP